MTRTFAFLISTTCFALAAAPAAAGVFAVGNSAARSCFEAADSPTTSSRSGLDHCDEALRDGNLSFRDTVATYVNRGILKFRRGAHEQAIADYDEALRLDPDEPEAYLNKGVAMLRLPGRHADALPLFETALEKGTDRPAIAHFARAVAHELSGNVRAAYRGYREAARLDPRWDDPRTELARFRVRPSS
jgi:tetratricopeptide (TPR) repeat protein